jgi:exonuclease III
VYCLAAAGGERDFRTVFVAAVSKRVRNLVEVLRRKVVVTGDLNIARDVLDSVPARERLKNAGLEDFKDTPTRQILDKLLKPRPTGIMVDLCQECFSDRPVECTHMIAYFAETGDPREATPCSSVSSCRAQSPRDEHSIN